MKMKKVVLLFCLIIIGSSCMNKLLVVSKNKILDIQDNNLPDKQCILGTWDICSAEDSDGSQTLYNICPIIYFFQDGNGKLVFPSKNCFFQWAITEANSIVFSFNSKEDKELFITKDTEFNLNFYNKNKLQYLELIQKGNKNIYFLSRNRINSPCSNESVIQD